MTGQAGSQRRLAMARAAHVRTTDDGTPLTVDGQRVDEVTPSRLSFLISGGPGYLEVVTACR